MIRIVGVAAIFLISLSVASKACDGYKTHSNEELKELRDALKEPTTDSLDRLFAFEELVCSDRPVIRDYAIKTGLESTADPIIRQQVAFEAMMQKSSVEIELLDDKGLKGHGKQLFNQSAGILKYEIESTNREDGCLSWTREACRPSKHIRVSAGKMTMFDGNLQVDGTFELTETNEFIGYLRRIDERVPARVKLF